MPLGNQAVLLPVLLLFAILIATWIGGLIIVPLLAWRFSAINGASRYPARTPIFLRIDIHEWDYTRRFLWSRAHWQLRDVTFSLLVGAWRVLAVLPALLAVAFVALWLIAVFG